jgi:phosphatidate cytidylyltransferase
MRVIVAVVAIPFFIAATVYGGWYFFLLVLLIMGLGLREVLDLSLKKNTLPQTVISFVFCIGMGFIFFHELYDFLIPVILFFIVTTMTYEMFRNQGSAFLNIAATVFSVFYVAFTIGSMILLRNISELGEYAGAQLVFLVFVGIWACDTFAYYGGKFFGKRKFFERVSPKKTWEGAIAGFFGALLGAWVVMLVYELYGIEFSLTLTQTLIIGFFAGTLGQIGDLAESLLKRDAQVKDSSLLIPGHGGVLDRFDSMMFVGPVTYSYIILMVL